MNRKEKVAVSGLIALTMTGGGFAFGASVNNVSSDQVIYACVTGVNGNITKVSNSPHSCPKGTSPLSWNIVGLNGNQGIRGDQGDKGDKGVAGESYGAYITNNKNEHVADVVAFDALTGAATIRVNKSYWYFTDQDGIKSIAKLALKTPGWNYLAQTKYYVSTDCSGPALYPPTLRNWNPGQNFYPIYNGMSITDTSGWVPSPAIAEAQEYGIETHSEYRSYRDDGFGDSPGCYERTFRGGYMYELKPYLPNLGVSPKIVSAGDN